MKADSMIVYKSSIYIIFKNLVYGVFGGGVAAFIASWFLELQTAIMIGGALGLVIIYFALIGDHIKVEIEGDVLSVYRLGKLRYQFTISTSGFHAKIKTTDGDSDCTLTVITPDGNSTSIDCSMLGRSRFYRLLDTLHVTDPNPIVLETKTKA